MGVWCVKNLVDRALLMGSGRDVKGYPHPSMQTKSLRDVVKKSRNDIM